MSEQNYQATRLFTKNLWAIEIAKIQMFMNKTFYLGLSKLDLSKTVMYEFWYDYVKPKYGEKAKLCYMDIDSLIVYIKTEGIYADIAKNVETRFGTSNYELERPLPNSKKKIDG